MERTEKHSEKHRSRPCTTDMNFTIGEESHREVRSPQVERMAHRRESKMRRFGGMQAVEETKKAEEWGYSDLG